MTCWNSKGRSAGRSQPRALVMRDKRRHQRVVHRVRQVADQDAANSPLPHLPDCAGALQQAHIRRAASEPLRRRPPHKTWKIARAPRSAHSLIQRPNTVKPTSTINAIKLTLEISTYTAVGMRITSSSFDPSSGGTGSKLKMARYKLSATPSAANPATAGDRRSTAIATAASTTAIRIFIPGPASDTTA